MKQILIFMYCLGLTLITNAQSAPKQVPGTEGQKTHDEAPLNSAPPIFQFATYDGKFINNDQIPKNKPLIIALFSPSCDHCQIAIREMKQKNELFKNVTIIFVASLSTFTELDNFVKITGIANSPNIFVCAAQDNFITKFFMPNWILPQVMVYNKQQKLQKIFYETINNDSLLTYLNKP